MIINKHFNTNSMSVITTTIWHNVTCWILNFKT